MIGQLLKDGAPVATLGDDGQWTAPEEPLQKTLQLNYDPDDGPLVGSRHLGWGVSALAAAADGLGLEVKLEKEPDTTADGEVY